MPEWLMGDEVRSAECGMPTGSKRQVAKIERRVGVNAKKPAKPHIDRTLTGCYHEQVGKFARAYRTSGLLGAKRVHIYIRHGLIRAKMPNLRVVFWNETGRQSAQIRLNPHGKLNI